MSIIDKTLTALKCAAGAFAVAAMFSDAAPAQERFQPADPEPGTEIPQAQVNFGMRPYADNTFYVIAMQKGWFDDVGITIGPDELGMKVNDTNVNALLLNGQLDISSQYCPLMLPTYKASTKLKCIAFTDTFLGQAILANPKLELKPFSEYIAEGMSFDEAIAAALAPLEGKTLVVPPQLSNRPFTDAAAAFSGKSWNIDVLDDSRSLVLARSGQIDFVNPEGAPVVYTLMEAGWTRVLGIGDLFEHAPGGAGSTVAPLVAIVGIGANADYVSENQNTVLRFLSVVWRTIDALEKDPSLFELQAPYLNSVAGTELDAEGVKATFDALHPLAPYSAGETYFRSPDSVLYYKNAWGGLITEFTEKGILPSSGLEADDIVWAASIWEQMEDYRTKSEVLIVELEGATLDDARRKLLEEARTHHERYNFLDAYRLALAAKG